MSVHIIGAGAWGTALALTARRAGSSVTLYTRRQDDAEELTRIRENRRYLPGHMLPPDLRITHDFSSLAEGNLVLLVTPTQSLSKVCQSLQPHLKPDIPIVLCAKGIEIAPPYRLPFQIVQSTLPNPLFALSGPNFAHEIAQNLPAAATLAGPLDRGESLLPFIHHRHFRCYLHDDILGVQIAGALKNVFSIACGMASSLAMGQNAIASLISRSLMEMRRFGLALGAHGETFLGLASVGDLTLTCMSPQSRNFSLGFALAQGQPLQDILANRRGVMEGLYTAKAAYHLGESLNIRMPLITVVYKMLYESLSCEAGMDLLLNRPFVSEIG